MGNCLSEDPARQKPRGSLDNARKSQVDLATIMTNENNGGDMSQKKYDDLEVKKLQKELHETPQIFVLNNLLMSIMFFEHYERYQLELLHSSVTTLGKELNQSLLRDETTECVVPDVVYEIVNKNVQFQRTHGWNKGKIEPLVPSRMCVINDNIEVLESKHTPQYSAIDKPSYQVVKENCEQQGFVKLKCCSTQARRIERTSPEPAEATPGPSSRRDEPDEIYDYSTIANVNTPKPIEITSYERRDTLPKSCFATKRIRKFVEIVNDYEDAENYDHEEEEEEEEEKPVNEEDLFETVSYISSNGFMTHFQSAVFPNSLGFSLGFGESEINSAKAIPGKIFCSLQDFDENIDSLPCEIIPSVAIQWPIELTFEFHNREDRPTMWDKFGVEYKWPTENMINDIRGLACTLIPRGYTPKRGNNPERDIQWEINFPKAQRYLDIHMSHTQVRAFLFLTTIYKSYIEPTIKQYDGLLIDHIRTHMYWECELNPRDWPEHRLGSKLVLVIKNLMQRLATGQLPDFFIKRKNTFVNVPNKYLRHAQKVFHDVLESPAVYFIGALRNLKYTNSKFYPAFDVRQLYSILTAKSSQLINPRILNAIPPNVIPRNRRPPPVEGNADYIKEVQWRYKQEKINREKVLQKKREQQEENLRVERKASVDSIDYEWQSENKFDNFKTKALLTFFIKHFIEMGKKSRLLANLKQSLFYLKQAYYLAKILDDHGLKGEAREFQEVISREEDISKQMSVTEAFEQPPSTPKRNSSQPIWDPHQIKGKNKINLNNLNLSYNNTAVPVTTNLKKSPKTGKNKSSILRNSADERPKSAEYRKSIVEFSETVEVR